MRGHCNLEWSVIGKIIIDNFSLFVNSKTISSWLFLSTWMPYRLQHLQITDLHRCSRARWIRHAEPEAFTHSPTSQSHFRRSKLLQILYLSIFMFVNSNIQSTLSNIITVICYGSIYDALMKFNLLLYDIFSPLTPPLVLFSFLRFQH